MITGSIAIDTERCKGCKLCTVVCPQHVLQMSSDQLNAKGFHPAVLNETIGHCTGCGICAVICPDVCITVYRDQPVRRVKG